MGELGHKSSLTFSLDVNPNVNHLFKIVQLIFRLKKLSLNMKFFQVKSNKLFGPCMGLLK